MVKTETILNKGAVLQNSTVIPLNFNILTFFSLEAFSPKRQYKISSNTRHALKITTRGCQEVRGASIFRLYASSATSLKPLPAAESSQVTSEDHERTIQESSFKLSVNGKRSCSRCGHTKVVYRLCIVSRVLKPKFLEISLRFCFLYCRLLNIVLKISNCS